MQVEKLKCLLGIAADDGSLDTSLQFVLDDVQEAILNYCNLEELPAGLKNTAYRMAIDLYRYDRPGDDSTPVVAVSISEGDTSTSFTGAAEALEGGFLKDYHVQLNRYRKLRW